MDEALSCPHCRKSPAYCVCAGIVPVENRVFALILQHPQEQDHELGTGRLALRHLQNGKLAIGLSWPNMAKALGRAADPKHWGVLYLGSAKAEDGAALTVLGRRDRAVADPAAILATIEGLIVLDGSWSQAKALWWRNPWLLKLHRIVLDSGRPSRYGRIRREPRRDSLSTLESLAFALSRLEGNPQLETRMTASFEELLNRCRR
jgi:DTW domain-containing protein YfiP